MPTHIYTLHETKTGTRFVVVVVVVVVGGFGMGW